MSGSGQPPAGRPIDYRDKIRAARERVNAAAAESEKLAASQKSSKSRNASSSSSSHAQSPVIRNQQATASFPGTPDSKPAPSETSADSMAGPGDPPQRPYRSQEQGSWFTVTNDSQPTSEWQQEGEGYAHRRDEVTSYAETDSLYSQPGAGNEPVGTFYTTSSSRASHPSDTSSLGGAPEVPVIQYQYIQQQQQQQQPPPQSAYAVPVRIRHMPPTSRRGTESYYSHRSVISPIAEETPQALLTPPVRSRQSINTISEQSTPISRSDKGTFLEDNSDEEHYLSPISGDVSPGPLRHASIGRAAKPSVTVVRNPSSYGSGDHSHKLSKSSSTETARIRQSVARASSNLGLGVGPDGEEDQPPLPQGFLSTAERARQSDQRTYSHHPTDLAPVVEEILDGLQKGGALPTDMSTIHSSSDGRQSLRPSPRPHTDRVSTSSLSELIKRATRVRTNLDRGKTASRLGLQDYLNGSGERVGGYEKSVDADQTPPWYPHEMSSAGSEGRHAYLYNGHDGAAPSEDQPPAKKGPRRCCGMPPWLFILLLLLIVICIAAAIIIPVELVVVPRQNAANAAARVADIAGCPSSHPCQNSGTSVIYNGACSCACVNNYSGSNCQTINSVDIACAKNTSSVSANLGNLTMGNSIPPLLENSQTSFAVNLNVTALAGAFSAASLRCDDENALVAFRLVDMRRWVGDQDRIDGQATPTASSTMISQATPAPPFGRPQQAVELRRDVTSANLLFAVTSTSSQIASSAMPSSAAANATSTASAPASASSAASGLPGDAYVAFSQVAVLYLLQQIDLATAQSARTELLKALNKRPFMPVVVDLGHDVEVDLNTGTIMTPGMKVGTGLGVH